MAECEWTVTQLECARTLPSLVARLQHFEGVSVVQRVSQLDADVFDDELVSLLKRQVNQIFDFMVRRSVRL